MPITAETAGLLNVAAGVAVLAFLRKPLAHPDRRGSTWFAATIVGCALWLLALGVGYLLPSAPVRVAAWSVRLLAADVVSASWLLLVGSVTGARWQSRRLVGALACYVALAGAILATNGLHGLAFDPATVGGRFLNPATGTWFWVQGAVNYVLMAVAMGVAAVAAVRASGLRRTQCAALAFTPLLPVAVNLAVNVDLVPVGPDLTPLGLFASAFVLSWALYRAALLAVVPLARRTAVEEMSDAVVTVDAGNRVVDCNAAARDRFGVHEGFFGEPLAEFLDGVPDRAVRALEEGGAPRFRLQSDGRDQFLDCAVSSLDDGATREAGRVIVFRDVTDRTVRERRLLEQNESLESFASAVSRDIADPLETARERAEHAKATGDVSEMDEVLEAAERIDRHTRSLLQDAQTARSAEERR